MATVEALGQRAGSLSSKGAIAVRCLLVASEGLGSQRTVNQGGTAVILKCYAHL